MSQLTTCKALEQCRLADQGFHDQLYRAIKSVAVNGKLSTPEFQMFEAILKRDPNAPTSPVIQIGLSAQDWVDAAAELRCTVAQIKAVWEVECSGSGWFVDVRGEILAADGPGGFLDGPHLPKLLFEAHWFDRFTQGKYRQSHPNLSSASWNRRLYVGGQGEWVRLWNAIKLNEEAALKSASYGGPQIMGFNHKLAGFETVQAYVAAMKVSEANHLKAFVKFIINNGMLDELRKINNDPINSRPFARKYNGSGYAANSYDVKIATAHRKYA
jgi:hypothetical protein